VQETVTAKVKDKNDKTESSFPIPRLEEEPPKAYEAFLYFCLMGSDRTVDKAYAAATGKQLEGLQKRLNNPWHKWCAKYNWVDRSRKYDTWLAKNEIEVIKDERIDNIKLLTERTRQTYKQADETGVIILTAIGAAVKERVKPDEKGKVKHLEAGEAQKWASAYQAACSGNKLAREMLQEILGLDSVAKILEKDSTN
jgi:hypothetical protein